MFRPRLDLSRRGVIAAAGALAAVSASAARATNVTLLADRSDGHGAFDHGPFDALLSRFARASTDGITRVNYAAWKGSLAEHARLRHYIGSLAASDPSHLSRDEQFAYWANLYNALTVDVVLEAYPVTSIRQIKPNLLSIGPWKKEVVRVMGIELSLDAIEQDILRKRWRDPRVHYAVNCASISCPNLPARAWRGTGLSLALDAAARAYVNHPRGCRFEGNGLVVSSIYRWYAADFGGSDAAIIGHLRSFAAAPLRARLDATSRITRDIYDWSLNDAPTR